MVNIVPEAPSFGTQFARSIGAGLGSGVSKGVDFATQMALEKYKTNQRRKLIGDVKSGRFSEDLQGEPKQDINQRFLEALPQIEQLAGRELTPEDLNTIWSKLQGHQQQMAEGSDRQEDPVSEAERRAEAYAAAGEHDLSRFETERSKSLRKERSEERKETFGLAKPTLERGRELLEDLPYKENALAGIKDSIETGNLGMFSLDNLAEMTGIEGLRSPEGAAFKTQSKEFFLGNLSRVGSRGLNQMMERVILEMAPLIGRSAEANLAVTEVLDAENDVTRKEAELINEIGQSYKEKNGHYPEDLQHRVYKELRPYAIQRQKDAVAAIDKIKQRYQPKNKEGILMYDPSGNLRRVPHGNKKEAIREGYRIP